MFEPRPILPFLIQPAAVRPSRLDVALTCYPHPQYEETLNTLKYANRAKQMTPPQMPQKQEHSYNAVQEQVRGRCQGGLLAHE